MFWQAAESPHERSLPRPEHALNSYPRFDLFVVICFFLSKKTNYTVLQLSILLRVVDVMYLYDRVV